MTQADVLSLKFILARNLQQESTLMTIPAGLRMKVSRYLLRDPDVFRVMDNEALEKWLEAPELQNIELSAQILRTCQQLYSEGVTILRQENTAGLRLDMRICPRLSSWQQTLHFRVSAGGFNASKNGFAISVNAGLQNILEDWRWSQKPCHSIDMKTIALRYLLGLELKRLLAYKITSRI